MKKVVDGVTTEYRMAGSLLISERTDGTTLWYQYDSAANLVALMIGTERYNYIRNAQNDIIGLIDSTGKRVVSYKYDSWGKVVSITGTLAATVGKKNPFRYRGYYFDAESGKYYLQSRYYDPEIRRFISADNSIPYTSVVSGYNLFAYCINNPVNMYDPKGRFALIVVGIAVRYTVKGVERAVEEAVGYVKESKGQPGKLLPTGVPGSSEVLRNPDGTIKQKRWYGPDGRAVRDRDYNHSGENIEFPHDHTWNNGKRSKDHEEPSPDYEFWGYRFLGAGLVVATGIGSAIVGGDDLTGAGIGDDFLLLPLANGFKLGMKMFLP